jgi:ATP-dependent DNA helicase RecG
MNWDELVDLTGNPEWENLEFKEARDNVPANCYETVSAFANTSGGWLIFGVIENKRSRTFKTQGIRNIDRVQNEFINAAQPPVLSRQLQIDRYLVQNEDRSISVLAFYIHPAQRRDRPIYLNGDIRKAYIRVGASDKECSPNDLIRFLRDASEETFNGQPLDLDPETCFDWQQVQWYRREYYFVRLLSEDCRSTF